MKIGFVVNQIKTELPAYTTTRLAMTATNLGHEVWLLGVGDFEYSPDGSLHAHARSVRSTAYEDLRAFMAEIQEPSARCEKIRIDDLDVLMLRNDPAEDCSERPWAQTSGILFGHLAVERGVMVVNDPEFLATALNKTYFQHFPEQVRPQTCISRNLADIQQFIDQHERGVVIKPLQGSGGHNVFFIKEGERANRNQMIEAVLRDGYCIVQEYLPAAAEGDVRLFVMNGQALQQDGHYAAFRRVNKNGDGRSNMHSGGESVAAEVTPQMLDLVEAVRPKLVHDGMYLVGLDIVEDKLMEINVFSPGGIGSVGTLTGIDFTEVVIRDLERKVRYKQLYGGRLRNRELATL